MKDTSYSVKIGIVESSLKRVTYSIFDFNFGDSKALIYPSTLKSEILLNDYIPTESSTYAS